MVKRFTACTVSAVILAIGGSIAIALLYRWKYFEEANAKIYRGQAFGNLMPQALLRMFPVKSLEAALAAQQRAVLAGVELDTKSKQKLRGRSVAEYRAKPTTAKNVLPSMSSEAFVNIVRICPPPPKCL